MAYVVHLCTLLLVGSIVGKYINSSKGEHQREGALV